MFWSFCSRPLWSIIFDMLTQEKHFIAKPGQIPQWFCSGHLPRVWLCSADVPNHIEVVATKWLLEIFVGPRSRCLMGTEIWFDHFVALALGLGAAFCRGAGSGGSDRSYKSLFQLLHVNWKGDRIGTFWYWFSSDACRIHEICRPEWLDQVWNLMDTDGQGLWNNVFFCAGSGPAVTCCCNGP